MIEILGLREMPLIVSIPYLIDTEPPPKRRKGWHEGRIRIKMHLGSLFERPHPTKGLCGQGCCRKSVAGAGLPHPFVATSCLLPTQMCPVSLSAHQISAHPAGSERAGDCEVQPQPRYSGCCFSKLPQGASISEGYRAGSRAVAEAGRGAGAHRTPCAPPAPLQPCRAVTEPLCLPMGHGR